MNPYYDADKLGWEIFSVEYGDGGDEFDTRIFVKTPNGVFSAHDSGCSCPTPFEDFNGDSAEKIEAELERVESVAHGLELYKSNISKYDQPDIDPDEVKQKLQAFGLK